MAKATARTKQRAKAKGIKLTTVRSGKRRNKTEGELMSAINSKIKAKKRRTSAPIPKWGASKVKTSARVLGSRGGKAKARKMKKRK